MSGALRAERLIRALRSRQPLILITGGSTVGHAMVLYGVHVTESGIDLLVMDPMSGYQTLPIAEIQDAPSIGVIGPA